MSQILVYFYSLYLSSLPAICTNSLVSFYEFFLRSFIILHLACYFVYMNIKVHQFICCFNFLCWALLFFTFIYAFIFLCIFLIDFQYFEYVIFISKIYLVSISDSIFYLVESLLVSICLASVRKIVGKKIDSGTWLAVFESLVKLLL